MTATFESTIRADLDRLAGSVRRPLSRRQWLRASDRAAAVALRALPGVAACVLLMRLLAGGSMALMTAIALGVTLVIGGVVFLRQAARIHVGRVEVLALADRRLGLGDRAVITAQFVDERERDGFRQAALVEAKPWVERALDRPVSADDDAVHDWRRSLPHALAGLAMLALAMVAGRAPERGVQAPKASVTVPGRSIDTAETRRPDEPGSRSFDPADAIRRIAAAVGLGGADPASGRAAGRGDGAAASESGGADGAPAGTAGAGAGGRGGDGGGSGKAGNGGMAGTDGVSGSDGAGSDDGAAGALDTSADRGDPAAREGAASPAAAAAAAPAAAGWPAGGSPPAADGGNGTPRQGGGVPNSGKSSSQRGEGGSSGAPSGQTQGQGNGTGTDAVKRSRGLAALMLALPMEDKLAGTPNRGPARSGLRRTSPTSGATAPAAAGERGAQNGAIGLASHRPLVAQDEALVARYFDRNAGTPGQRR